MQTEKKVSRFVDDPIAEVVVYPLKKYTTTKYL